MAFKQVTLSLKVNYYLQTEIDMFFKGIFFEGGNEAKQKREMQKFYGEHQKYSKEFIGGMNIQKAKVQLTNKTPLNCDGRITGEIRKLPAMLSSFFESSSYEISHSKQLFSFKMIKIQEDMLRDNMTLRLTYSGKVLEHNADAVEGKTLVWKFVKGRREGLFFTLDRQTGRYGK